MWQPQEIQHGLILDRLQVELGRESADADLESIGLKLKILGALAHIGPFQDVCRMLYYLTGMATERSAVLAYNLLHRGTLDLGETGDRAHRWSARSSARSPATSSSTSSRPGRCGPSSPPGSGGWSGSCAGSSFAPVGANNAGQKADFGDVMAALGIAEELDDFAVQISRVEKELLWARDRGLKVPDYVSRAFHEAVELARDRAHLPHLHR